MKDSETEEMIVLRKDSQSTTLHFNQKTLPFESAVFYSLLLGLI